MEMIFLFHRFPTRAAEFLMDLQMRPAPGLVHSNSRCDVLGEEPSQGQLIRPGVLSETEHDRQTDSLGAHCGGGQFWEPVLDDVWARSPSRDKKGCKTRAADVEWGVAVDVEVDCRPRDRGFT